MFTRIHDDAGRIQDQVNRSTGPGRWVLNVPGNGATPDYMADPHIRLQKWGGNTRTNRVDLESYLLGVNKKLCRNAYSDATYLPDTSPIEAPVNTTFYTEQPRAVNPAFLIRDVPSREFPYLGFNPQAHVPFERQLPIMMDTRRHIQKAYMADHPSMFAPN